MPHSLKYADPPTLEDTYREAPSWVRKFHSVVESVHDTGYRNLRKSVQFIHYHEGIDWIFPQEVVSTGGNVL